MAQPDRCFYSRFANTAAQQPDAPALETPDCQALTHGGLLALADSTARRFEGEGLGPGAFIGWLGHNSAEMLAALLACAKLGAVFVPLNWRLAAPELAAIVRDAGLSALKFTLEMVALAGQVLALQPCPGADGTDQAAQPSDLMLVYTSGTTGAPRGAMHTQRSMLANIDMALAVQGLSAQDRVLALLPLFHVGGLCIQVLPALACGAVVRLHARFDADAWLQDVATWRPSTSLLVPAVMQALIAHPAWPDTDLSSLRFVNSGSSIVPVALIRAFAARGVAVAQVYGGTETGPVSVALRPELALRHIGAAGQPAPGVRLRLVAADGVEVLSGTVGEIQLQAPNLMRGYHRLPAGTGFVDGWFATGDLAFAGDCGFVTVVGRCQDLIISGGENIYPAEIEMLALAWPGVAEAAVVGQADARWGEVPVLALAGVDIDLDGLRRHLGAELARYKQPRRIVLLPGLPRTALGKVQKQQLLPLLTRVTPR